MSTEERLERIERLLSIGMKEVMNIDECAMFLGITTGTLYNKVNKRLIPYYKHSGRIFFKKSELEEFLCDNKVDSESEIKMMASDFLIKHKKKHSIR